ncbi:alpha-tocopherol transfer protein-like [Diabrotica virgifera virgifera]|uniref:Alpha-tocopherol transfer protein-like n=1 Tax=Diabrotica virgifera virgifera TaxID=50390 RepID=A0A6P7HHS1_DIAVI|nr:alpha-tocopherol transfer protein-like [Diabrotica virgifera virgifera]
MTFKEISVEEVYQNDNKLKKQDVLALEEWMKKQPHLPKATELQLAIFLHSSNYSNEMAKNVIESYFTMKTLCSDFLGNRTLHDDVFKLATHTYVFSVLPKQALGGEKVVISKLMDTNLNSFTPLGMLKLMDVVLALFTHENGPPCGFQLVFDMQNSSLAHFLKVNPMLIKKFIYYLQDAMPIRLKHIHFIYPAFFLDKIFSLIKPMMKKELFELFIVHSDLKSLFEYVPQDILPEDYGGNCKSLLQLQAQEKQKIEDGEAFLKFQESQVVDESKRQGKSKYNESLFGIDGSFKTLEFD